MHVYQVVHACATAFFTGTALPNISQFDNGQLVKMLITLIHMTYLDKIVHAYTFKHCPDTGIKKVRRLRLALFWLVDVFKINMFITLELHGIF